MKDRSKETYYLDDMCAGCKHIWEDHFVNAINKQIWCGNNWNDAIEGKMPLSNMCRCQKFALDTLKHLELLYHMQNKPQ